MKNWALLKKKWPMEIKKKMEAPGFDSITGGIPEQLPRKTIVKLIIARFRLGYGN